MGSLVRREKKTRRSMVTREENQRDGQAFRTTWLGLGAGGAQNHYLGASTNLLCGQRLHGWRVRSYPPGLAGFLKKIQKVILL